MLTNICLLLIAFMLGLVVVFLFALCKIFKQFVDKYHVSVSYDVWGDEVSPDMVCDLVNNLNFFLFKHNGGDT